MLHFFTSQFSSRLCSWTNNDAANRAIKTPPTSVSRDVFPYEYPSQCEQVSVHVLQGVVVIQWASHQDRFRYTHTLNMKWGKQPGMVPITQNHYNYGPINFNDHYDNDIRKSIAITQ